MKLSNVKISVAELQVEFAKKEYPTDAPEPLFHRVI